MRFSVNYVNISVKVFRADGTEAPRNEPGRIVIKLPLPPGVMSTLYQAPERFCELYFSKYPVSLDPLVFTNPIEKNKLIIGLLRHHGCWLHRPVRIRVRYSAR